MQTYTSEELKEILELHKKWLDNKEDGVRANLSYANLRSANLSSADLRYANLRYANLRYANLSSADLRDADLSSANLSTADLSYANLSSANLSSADLRDADLRYANLSYANLRSADLRYANLRYANLRSADLRSAVGEMKYIKSIQCEEYYISYTYKKLNIGCQSHLIEDWKNFNDEQISTMDSGALNWWKAWKPILMNIIEVSPCEAHKDEE